jgi:hypothetical protein
LLYCLLSLSFLLLSCLLSFCFSFFIFSLSRIQALDISMGQKEFEASVKLNRLSVSDGRHRHPALYLGT